MQQQTDLCAALEDKLEMAERALCLSNHNVELTLQMWIGASHQDEELLAKRADNSAKIAALIQQLRDEVQSEDEGQLLDAACPRWSLVADYGELLHQITDGQSYVEAGAATANVMLPFCLITPLGRLS